MLWGAAPHYCLHDQAGMRGERFPVARAQSRTVPRVRIFKLPNVWALLLQMGGESNEGTDQVSCTCDGVTALITADTICSCTFKDIMHIASQRPQILSVKDPTLGFFPDLRSSRTLMTSSGVQSSW